MTQQLNLLDPRFAPRSLRFSAQQGLLAVGAALLLSMLAAGGLRWAGERAVAAGHQADTEQAPLRARVAALGASAGGGAGAELQQLQTLDAGQRRIRAALEGGAAGVREGHADYLLALARQASGAVWITGFSVSDDGSAIELEGRMTDTAQLTDYLRRLNAEPRFKGRPFAQLNLKAGDANGGAMPHTEFALRSTAVASNGKTP
jgi:Tfp pilus assembly protein PilN